MDTLTRERHEAEVAMAARPHSDAISTAVGSPLYSTHHRFTDLKVDVYQQMSMKGGGLAVSRYYFMARIVVDVIRQPLRFQKEIAAKRAYCARKGLKYVLVADEFDDESVRQQLSPVRAPASRPRTTATAKPRRPRTRRTT